MGKKKVGAKGKGKRAKDDIVETSEDKHDDQDPAGDVDVVIKNDEIQDLLENPNEVSNESEDIVDSSSMKDLLDHPASKETSPKGCHEPPAITHAGASDEDGGDYTQEHEEEPLEKPVAKENEVSNEGIGEDEEEDEGPWELKKILTMADLTNACPIKCYTDDCPLPAAVLYASVSKTTFTYHYCLDCQVSQNDPACQTSWFLKSLVRVYSECRRTTLKDGLLLKRFQSKR